MNDYAKQLIKTLDENPNINTRKFIKLSKLGKGTFYFYSQILEASGYIAYKTVKNQRIWYLARRDKRHDLGVPDLEESILDKRYHTIKSKVMQSLAKIRKGDIKPDDTGTLEITVTPQTEARVLSGYVHVTTDNPQKKEVTIPVYASPTK